MLHAAGFLMSWLTGKRAHILSISLFSHSRLSHLLALLCSVSLFYCVPYMKMSALFLYIFKKKLRHFGSCAPTILCPAVTLLVSLPLCCHFFFSLLSFSSCHPPLWPSSIFLLASLFCAMPQGPPGPQGSPHPQPPPPNSMMGPHSQVTLPLPPFSLFLFLQSFGNAGSQCWCFMLWHSSQLKLNALCCCQNSHKHAIEK